MTVAQQAPYVSVVTPFYNTADHLAECIESVLGQSFSNYEYLLVNNMSNDGSREIAEQYARSDWRIRLIDNDAFLAQIDNYSSALAHVSPNASYVKMVQADDMLLPGCVASMVVLAERQPGIGIVSSDYLWGDELRRSGIDERINCLSGREARRQMLLERRQLTGSQTTVLYRADIVRMRKPFFASGRHFADTDAAFEILREHDLGYVHEVLSYSRKANDGSILTSTLAYHPFLLHLYLSMERYGPDVLTPSEFAVARAALHREYYSYLARQALRLRGRAFWDFHRVGLASLGRELRWRDLVHPLLVELAWLAVHPQGTLKRAFFGAALQRERHDAGQPA